MFCFNKEKNHAPCCCHEILKCSKHKPYLENTFLKLLRIPLITSSIKTSQKILMLHFVFSINKVSRSLIGITTFCIKPYAPFAVVCRSFHQIRCTMFHTTTAYVIFRDTTSFCILAGKSFA